ncbi:MAG TPA: histidinol-phosphate transaminase [Candidatus Paenalcaligenes intestinipullorum]|uniref:Histidinol-phosphate aminotransferase n=1 Tax=Candidatus Paenalcaligenes intestinipullorum TaxID=2838718 RepID=A0A9D2U7L9_9BURK|nr:histidinol-phosphate transaminase [Candidatus Paenalcaligenes intestinipullorum]
MSQFWSDQVRQLRPYVPGEQLNADQLIKLNTNENPYGPSPKALAAIRDAADERLRLYPSYDALALRQAIAELHQLSPEHVFVGNGSDEVLAHIFSGLFLRGGRPLLLPDISYSFYYTYCQYYQVPAEVVPLDEDFTLRVADYTQTREQPPAGIIFANPNAPTSLLLELDQIQQILRANPDTVVVVDEAYIDFGGKSASCLVAEHPNLVVVQTVSKSYALAGLRVGFALAQPELIQGLERIKDSFNSYPLDRLALAGATAAIQDQAYLHECIQKILESRIRLTEALSRLGFKVLPSSTNFVFATHPEHDAAQLQQALRAQNILIRHFSQPRIQDYLRITVGTPEQCDQLIQALTALLNP